MSEDNVQRILKKYGDAARCSNPKLPSIHPHLLRHSYGAQLYRLGVSLPEIAKLLGKGTFGKALAGFFAVAVILALGFMGDRKSVV